MGRRSISGITLIGVCALLLAISGCASGTSPSGTAASHPKVLVKEELTAKSGGSVTADGVKLVVPAGALQANGAGEITAQGDGKFDIFLTAPWHGKLQVTIPLAGPSDIVMHQVSGLWIPEGSAPGQSTVTVTHLSLFSALSSLGSKIVSTLCLGQGLVGFLTCWAAKGLEYVDKSLLQALAAKAASPCEASLLAQVENGKAALVAVGTLIKMFTGACVGQAGEGNWTPPVTGTPSLPSTGGPIQGGTPPIQGGSPPLQGPTSAPTPAPSTAPVPPGSGRIIITPCLNLRSGPNGDTTLVGCIPYNTVIDIVCTAQGNSVTGPYGATTLWDETSYDGTAGYVSDAWVYTGSNGAVAGSC